MARSRTVFFAKVLVALLALAALVAFTDAQALASRLRHANLFLVILGIAVFLFGQYWSAQRWRGALKFGHVCISRLEAWQLGLIGTFFGNFIPGQAGGDLIKAAYLFRGFPNDRSFILASAVYDRLMGLSAVVFFTFFASVMFGLFFKVWDVFVVSGLAIAVGLASVFLLKLMFRARSARVLLRRLAGRRISGLLSHTAGLFRQKTLFVRSFGLSMIFQSAWILMVWLMYCAVEPDIKPLTVVVSAPAAVLAGLIPVTPGGLGIREGSLSMLMQNFGAEPEVATAGALLSLTPVLVAAAIGGVAATVGPARFTGSGSTANG